MAFNKLVTLNQQKVLVQNVLDVHREGIELRLCFVNFFIKIVSFSERDNVFQGR